MNNKYVMCAETSSECNIIIIYLVIDHVVILIIHILFVQTKM